MKTRTLLLAFLAALAPAVEAQTHQLFNGKNLDGWIFLSNQPGPAGFAVNHGVLETTDGNKGMLCYTKEKIGKATIRVVYKMSNEKGNSGVFIRIPTEPKSEADAINKGIEVQIDNRDDDWHCTGVLYSMTKAMARPYKPSGEWNTMDLRSVPPQPLLDEEAVAPDPVGELEIARVVRVRERESHHVRA